MPEPGDVVDPPQTEHLFDIHIDIKARLDVGQGPVGRRIFYCVDGGRFVGPRVKGEVLPHGGDWGLFNTENAMQIDARLILRVEDGALISMTYGGRWKIDPGRQKEVQDPHKRAELTPTDYYYRITTLFETGDPAHAWLNDAVCAGTGWLTPSGVAYRIFRLL